MKNPLSKWLSDDKFEILKKNSETYSNIPPLMLFEQVFKRLQEIEEAAKNNREINLDMAKAVYNALKSVVDKWNHIDEPSKYYLRGALGYFIDDDDDEGDFDSSSGFVDDLEVVNACLHRAGLEELVIDPYDY